MEEHIRSGDEFYKRRFLTFFYPPEIPISSTFKMRESVRRGRLLADVALALMLILVLLVPATFFIPNKFVILLMLALIGTCLLVLFLNRIGATTMAGVVMVVAVEITLSVIIFTTRPFDSFNLPLFDFFCIPLVLSVSLLPAESFLLVLVANALIIIGSLLLQTHSTTFQAALHTQFYNILIRPMAIQIGVVSVCYFWVRNAKNALKRADRAEEIARLQEALAKQAEKQAEEKQVLEQSIQMLVQYHVKATNDHIISRIPSPQASVLIPLVGAINSLWSRLQRAQQAEQDLLTVQKQMGWYIQSFLQGSEITVPESTIEPLGSLMHAAQRHMKRKA